MIETAGGEKLGKNLNLPSTKSLLSLHHPYTTDNNQILFLQTFGMNKIRILKVCIHLMLGQIFLEIQEQASPMLLENKV